MFEQLAAIQIGNAQRAAQLRQRYLALIVDSGATGTDEKYPNEIEFPERRFR
jgi:hypothetical protein